MPTTERVGTPEERAYCRRHHKGRPLKAGHLCAPCYDSAWRAGNVFARVWNSFRCERDRRLARIFAELLEAEA